MSLWGKCLDLGAQLVWKLNESSGTTAADFTANNRPGTYVGAPTLGRPTLIPNALIDTAIGTSSGKYVRRTHEAWMNTNTASFCLTVKPASLGVQRDIAGKTEVMQLWIETDGRLTMYVAAPTPWSSASSVNTMSAGGTYFVVVSFNGTQGRVWVNGTLWLTVNVTGNLRTTTDPMVAGLSTTLTSRAFNGDIQGFAWFGYGLNATQAGELWTEWQAAPGPAPTDPVWIYPGLGNVLGESYIIRWEPSTVADGNPIVYDVNLRTHPAGAWLVGSGDITNAFLPQSRALRLAGTQYQYRVRARVPATGTSSSWVESEMFTMAPLLGYWEAHLSPIPDPAALLWKLDDTLVSTTIADSSGNNRPGTLTSLLNLTSVPSIIPNAPENALQMASGAGLIRRAHEAWMNSQDFTLFLWYSRPSAQSSGNLFYKFGSFFATLLSSARLRWNVLNTLLDSPNNVLPADTPVMIAVSFGGTDTDEARIYINGFLVASVVRPQAYTPATSNFFQTDATPGVYQGLAFFVEELSAPLIHGMYNLGVLPALQPHEFFAPVEGALVTGTAAVSFTEVYQADSHELEAYIDGAWVGVASGLTGVGGTVAFDWDTSDILSATDVQLRARGVVGGSPSTGWFYSDLFTIANISPTPPLGCEFELDVYEDDRTTIAWSVGTSPEHAYPFLKTPSNYGESIIDIVNGAATIAQIEVAVVDRRQVEGDQDSGFLTERVQGIHGRRCRLRRYVSAALGYVVIIDGPAGAPRLANYATFRWVVRDTRETERKRRAFQEGGTTAVYPHGLLEPWGPVTDVVAPEEGRYGAGVATSPSSSASLGPVAGDFPTAIREEAVELFEPYSKNDISIEEIGPFVHDTSYTVYRVRYERVRLYWRPAGTADPWTTWDPVIDWPVPPNFSTIPDWNWRLLNLDLSDFSVRSVLTRKTQIPGMVAGQDYEFFFLSLDEPSPTAPFHLSGMTAGELLRDLYDGVYSPRDPDTGAIVPTGIRYKLAAVLAITTPVLGKIEAPWDDIRDMAERKIYKPLGWVAALDSDLDISPISQVPPEDSAGMLTISNEEAVPTDDWNAGSRIINVLTFNYPRFYVPDVGTSPSLDNVLARSVTYEFRDPLSISRHDEQAVTYEGDLFGAVGNGEAGQVAAVELGASLAQLRRLYVFERYRNGAPAIRLPVHRAHVAALRAGGWVFIDLSWFPDYATRRRHMVTRGQVLAIADLDCTSRELLIEEAFPVEPGS